MMGRQLLQSMGKLTGWAFILSLAHLAFFAATCHLLPTIYDDPITELHQHVNNSCMCAAVVNILNVQLADYVRTLQWKTNVWRF